MVRRYCGLENLSVCAGEKIQKRSHLRRGLRGQAALKALQYPQAQIHHHPRHANCHDHVLTYLTAKSPDDLERYQLLRNSVVRTLSCEQLPRGTSDGPFCFGDSNSGYTIAYAFRLPDPKARGRRRAYALLALAGKDANRAFRACPTVWEAFAAMAQAIEKAAQRHQAEQKLKEENEGGQAKTRNYTPVSSFLTQRTCDPDGYVRRTGGIHPSQPRRDRRRSEYLHRLAPVLRRHATPSRRPIRWSATRRTDLQCTRRWLMIRVSSIRI